MLAVTHLAVGLAGGLLLLTPLIERWDNSTLAILSGIWALVPDVNVFVSQLSFIESSMWGNVFWFHNLLDGWETGHPEAEAMTALAFLVLTVVFLEYHDYY
jgi:hypothetical protein